MNTGFSFNVPSFPVSTHNNTVSATCYLIMHNYRLSFLKFILLKVNATQRSFFKKITKFFLLCTMIGHIKTHQKMKKKMGVTILFWKFWGETVILDYEENTKIEKYDLWKSLQNHSMKKSRIFFNDSFIIPVLYFLQKQLKKIGH